MLLELVPAKTVKRVSLRDLILPVQRGEVPLPGTAYRQIGVRLWGEGAYERETIDGSETQYSQLFRVEAGDIIVNKIWARNGSIAVVSDELAGCFGSNEFPTFVVNQKEIEPRWFHWFTKTPDLWRQCDLLSRGTSGKNRLRPEKFLGVEIPLPPPPEQRRIVAQLDAVAEKLEQARNLISSIDYDLQQMIMNLIWGSLDNPTPLCPCNSFMKRRPLDTVVKPEEEYHFAGVYSFGRGVFQGQKKKGNEFKYSQLTKLKKWNFVYPKLMAWEGALGVVPEECEGCFVSPEFPVFDIDENIIHPLIVDAIFRDSRIWPKLQDGSSGTNMRRKRVNPDALLAFQIPVPKAEQQKVIVSLLENQKISKLEHFMVLEELSCLLPAMLHRAFENGDEGQMEVLR